MAENSKIEWTTHTFNPWIGCTKVHEGCTHCYAEAFAKRTGKAKWGPSGTRVKTSEANWRKPLKWNRESEASGVRARVFCASLADVFEDWTGDIFDHHGDRLWASRCIAQEDVPALFPEAPQGDFSQCRPARMADIRMMLFRLIDATPHLDWLLLTKRPENIPRMWCSHINTDGKPPSQLHRHNVWLGTSISTQPTTDKMVGELVKCRDLAPVLFLSAEPLLGKVTFRWAKWQPWGTKPGDRTDHLDGLRKVDQVIIGNESSGPRVGSLGEFMSEGDWRAAAMDIVDECQEANVAAFVKQVPIDRQTVHDITRFPAKLQVRQMPQPLQGAPDGEASEA